MEEINIGKILKSVIKKSSDILLYSPIYGTIKLKEITEDRIICTDCFTGVEIWEFDYTGHHFSRANKFCFLRSKECLLFPSEDNRDWDAFKREHNCQDTLLDELESLQQDIEDRGEYLRKHTYEPYSEVQEFARRLRKIIDKYYK